MVYLCTTIKPIVHFKTVYKATSKDKSPEKWKTLSTVVAHDDSGSWHSEYKSVQNEMAEFFSPYFDDVTRQARLATCLPKSDMTSCKIEHHRSEKRKARSEYRNR
jgi:hypothetical protein